MSSINKFRSNILYNRYILYFFLAVSLIDLYYLSQIKDYMSVTIFILVGLLVSFFNKNMIVIMMVALSVTHLLKYGIKSTLNEGMQDKEEEEQEEFQDAKPKDPSNMSKEEIDTDNVETHQKLDELNGTHQKLKEMNKDMQQFDNLQQNILSKLGEISPLLDKAENFIEKFEHYKQ